MPQMLCGAALRLLTTGVQAEAACTKSHGLQQATGHRDVLEEMDELGLVGQRAVENRCGENTEQRQYDCSSSGESVAPYAFA